MLVRYATLNTAASCHPPHTDIGYRVYPSPHQYCSSQTRRRTAGTFHRGSSTDARRKRSDNRWSSSNQAATPRELHPLHTPRRPSHASIRQLTHLAARLPRSRDRRTTRAVVARRNRPPVRAAGGTVVVGATTCVGAFRRSGAVVARRAALTPSHGGVGPASRGTWRARTA